MTTTAKHRTRASWRSLLGSDRAEESRLGRLEGTENSEGIRQVEGRANRLAKRAVLRWEGKVGKACHDRQEEERPQGLAVAVHLASRRVVAACLARASVTEEHVVG